MKKELNNVEDIDVAEGIDQDIESEQSVVTAPVEIPPKFVAPEVAPPVAKPAPARPVNRYNPVFWGKVGETKGNGGYVHKTYGHYVDGAGTFVKTVDFDKDGRIVATSVVFAPGVALDGFRLKKQK